MPENDVQYGTYNLNKMTRQKLSLENQKMTCKTKGYE